MYFRVFGSGSCDVCKMVVEICRSHGLPYEFLDANSNDNESLCDLYDVYQLPHVQLMSEDNNILVTLIGHAPDYRTLPLVFNTFKKKDK